MHKIVQCQLFLLFFFKNLSWSFWFVLSKNLDVFLVQWNKKINFSCKFFISVTRLSVPKPNTNVSVSLYRGCKLSSLNNGCNISWNVWYINIFADSNTVNPIRLSLLIFVFSNQIYRSIFFPFSEQFCVNLR